MLDYYYPAPVKTVVVGVDSNGDETDPADGIVLASLASERNIGTANQYGVGVDECEYDIVSADSDVSSSTPALLFGVTVIAATASNVIEIRDATSAGSGTVVLSIPASTAIGTYYPCNGIKLDTGLFVDFTGTGTLRIDWRLQ